MNSKKYRPAACCDERYAPVAGRIPSPLAVIELYWTGISLPILVRSSVVHTTIVIAPRRIFHVYILYICDSRVLSARARQIAGAESRREDSAHLVQFRTRDIRHRWTRVLASSFTNPGKSTQTSPSPAFASAVQSLCPDLYNGPYPNYPTVWIDHTPC